MPVDIFSIMPREEQSGIVAFGGAEITIRPLSIAQIARIAQRFAGFCKVYFSTKEELAALDAGFRAAAMIEAYPAMIVAGTRKDGATDSHLVEQHIERFPEDDILRAARAILRLTNGPPPDEEEDKGERPLTAGGDAPALDPDAEAKPSSSSSPLSNT